MSYDVEIRRTTHGVAHISGRDMPSVAYGQGYACAADHLATIADQVLKAKGLRSAHFGRGDNDRHLNSDFGYRALGLADWAAHMATTQTPEMLQIVDAYAAGINRWLHENGPDGVAGWARGAEWVRPLSSMDLFVMYADVTLMGSGRNLVEFVGSAQPPGASDATDPELPLTPSDHPGSNGWAFGGDVTASGGGIVMANPHFPWYGDGKFWECHLTIPGELDVYGASLVGAPGVHMGFNRDVAWTHTFSRGSRFTVYKLDLDSDGPTTYRYGQERRELTPTRHEVEVLTDDGTTVTIERDLWRSHHGPMVNIPLLGWSSDTAFAYRDANDRNDRFLGQFLAMDKATSVGALRDAVHHHQGLPWVNILAADRHGDAWYSDPSPTPNLEAEVDAEFRAATSDDLLTALFYSQRVALLDGSDPRTEWVDTGNALQPGCAPPDVLPELETREAVFNSNDPYWVCHESITLPSGPVLCGVDRRGLSPRTRMNAAVLRGDAPSGPGEQGWTAAYVWDAVLDNRSLLADQLLDEVIVRCDVGEIEVDGKTVDVGSLSEVLADWDRTFDIGATGAVLWREFLAQFSEEDRRNGGSLFETPFDELHPTTTPHGLKPRGEGVDGICVALARAASVLRAAGVDPAARLGDVQYIDRGGERIALHGANEVEGIINVVAPIGNMARSDLEPEVERGADIPGRTEITGLRQGGYQITYGTSFLMVVEFEADGPHATGLLTYGQSGDPESPHHVDQTRAFAAKQMREMLFTEEQITTDPELSSVRLTVE